MIPMTWRETYRAKFGVKHIVVARRLHASWRREARAEAARVEVASLSTRIGKLLKLGDATGWWKQRPIARRLFAELLDLDQDAVFGVPPGTARGLALPEFPTLPAIESGEEPCRLDRDGWLLQTAFRQFEKPLGGHVWVRALSGAGKTLVIRYLQQRHATEVLAVTVHSLARAAAHATSELPLVVEIEGPRPLEDLAALAPLTSRTARTIVLAPFELPLPGTLWYGDPHGGRNPAGWITVDGSPRGEWRERMLDWIDGKLERSERDTKLVKQDVFDWLARHDPRGVLVGTPGDLLALCADFDAWGSDGAGTAVRGRRWLDELGIAMLPEDTPSTWRCHAAARAYAALVSSHLRTTSRVFGTLSSESWEELIPDAVATPSTTKATGSAVAVGYLRDGGLLRGAERGLMPYPSLVAQGVANEMLSAAFEKPKPGAWGALAADETRQPVVDAALDALSDGAFCALLRSLAKHGEPTSLAELGAIEAALAALGRRLPIAPSLRGRDLEAAQRLMLLQINRLSAADGREVHHPYTRRSVDEWFTTGWAVSLHVDPPNGFSQEALAWEIPGWTSHLQFSCTERNWLPSSTVQPWGASVHVQRLAALASAVVEKLDAVDIPDDAPRVLLPAILLSETERILRPVHLDHIAGSWEETFLASRAAGLSADRRAVVAGRIWRLVAKSIAESKAPVAQTIEILRRRHPGFSSFVLEHLDADELARTASDHGIHRGAGSRSHHLSNPLELLALPRESRRAAVRGWLGGALERGSVWAEARELLPLLDADDLELALELARAGDRKIASEFTSFVWRASPSRAREEAETALRGNLPSVEGWFYQAPREELPNLVGLIEAHRPPPAWVSRWASRRVLDGGEASERLYRLTQTCDAARSSPKSRTAPTEVDAVD